MNVRINCSNCGGNVWTEKLPDSSTVIDLVCLFCGKRDFMSEHEYEEKLENAVKKAKKQGSIIRRAIPT